MTKHCLIILRSPGPPGLCWSAKTTKPCLYNPRLRRAYRIEDSIPVLLVDEAIEVDDDEQARLMGAGKAGKSPVR